MAKRNKILYSAVLPYSFWNDSIYYLLGKEHGGWDSFGGKPEYGETVIKTAAREAYEESKGLLGSYSDIEWILNNSASIRYNKPPHGPGCVYFMQIGYDDNLPMLFLQKQMHGKRFNEKTQISWYQREQMMDIKLRYPETLMDCVSVVEYLNRD